MCVCVCACVCMCVYQHHLAVTDGRDGCASAACQEKTHGETSEEMVAEAQDPWPERETQTHRE